MTIGVGDPIPDVELMTMTDEGPKPVSSREALGTGRVVLFAVPGAFTPTCSDYHLPGFVLRAEELRAKGVDAVACVSVNDPFVMGAWGKDQHVADTVQMLADGNGVVHQGDGARDGREPLRSGDSVPALCGDPRGRHGARSLRRNQARTRRQLGRVHPDRALTYSVR